ADNSSTLAGLFQIQENKKRAYYSLSQMQGMVSSGKVKPKDMVLPPGAQKWVWVAQVPELCLPSPATATADLRESFLSLMGSFRVGRPNFFIASFCLVLGLVLIWHFRPGRNSEQAWNKAHPQEL